MRYGLLSDGIDANALAVFAHALKLDPAVNQGEQGIVGANPDTAAGMDFGAALANENVACQNKLAVPALNSETLDSESRPFLVELTPFLWANS